MTMQLTRRHLLAGTASVLAAPAVLRRRAMAATTLTLGHGAAPGNPRAVAAEAFAKLVGEKTEGRVTVNIAGSEQLGNDVAMLTSLRMGALDITANSQGAASGLVPELATLGLPFLFEDSAAAFRVLDGPIGAELGEKFAAVGMTPLGWWDNGIRHITNSKKPINTPADLQGLTIRTPADPMTIDIFQALGPSTEQIAFSELYVALQQGVVDGQENPLANIASSKIYEVNKYISLSGHKWECNPFLISQIAVAPPRRRPRAGAGGGQGGRRRCSAGWRRRRTPSTSPSSRRTPNSRSTRSTGPPSRPRPHPWSRSGAPSTAIS